MTREEIIVAARTGDLRSLASYAGMDEPSMTSYARLDYAKLVDGALRKWEFSEKLREIRREFGSGV